MRQLQNFSINIPNFIDEIVVLNYTNIEFNKSTWKMSPSYMYKNINVISHIAKNTIDLNVRECKCLYNHKKCIYSHYHNICNYCGHDYSICVNNEWTLNIMEHVIISNNHLNNLINTYLIDILIDHGFYPSYNNIFKGLYICNNSYIITNNISNYLTKKKIFIDNIKKLDIHNVINTPKNTTKAYAQIHTLLLISKISPIPITIIKHIIIPYFFS